MNIAQMHVGCQKKKFRAKMVDPMPRLFRVAKHEQFPSASTFRNANNTSSLVNLGEEFLHYFADTSRPKTVLESN